MKFEEVKAASEYETIYGSKDYTVGESKYFVFVETLKEFGKNKGTLHVFHPAEMDKNEKFSWTKDILVAQWSAAVLDSNLEAAEVSKGDAIMIRLDPTPNGKKYYNFKVAKGEKVI